MKAFIKNFIERNKPIFYIGLATLLLFIALIVFYGIKPHKETGLSRIGNESNYNVVNEEDSNSSNEAQGGVETVPPEANIDNQFGVLEINYTENGFSPKAARAIQGQAVKWTNKTDKVIYLRQKTPTYPDLIQAVQIDPGLSFSYRLTKDGTWNYEEETSGSFAYVEVYRFSP